MQEGWYSIKQISQLTGLSTFVIRKWEERYVCVRPQRLHNGYRVYSEEDLQRLLRIKQLVDRGYTVKNALMTLADRPCEAPGDAAEPASGEASSSSGAIDAVELDGDGEALSSSDKCIGRLLSAAERCDAKSIRSYLLQSIHEKGLAFLLNAVLPCFLRAMREEWTADPRSELQRHVAATVVRDFLIQQRASVSERDDAPLLIGACLPSEHQEIPLHLVMLEASLKGWRTLYLGPSPSRAALEHAVERLKPNKVALYAATPCRFDDDPALLRFVEGLSKKYPRCSFYIGGEGVCSDDRVKRLSYVFPFKTLKTKLAHDEA